MDLLARQDHPHLCFAVFYQLTAYLHRNAVDSPGERERRLVPGRYRSADVHAADDTAQQSESERIGQLDFALCDEPGVEVKLTFAVCGACMAPGQKYMKKGLFGATCLESAMKPTALSTRSSVMW